MKGQKGEVWKWQELLNVYKSESGGAWPVRGSPLPSGPRPFAGCAQVEPSRRSRKRWVRRRRPFPRFVSTKFAAGTAPRLTPAEIDQLEWLKAHFGFGSNSDAIRALVWAASGMLDFDPVTAEKLNEVRGEMRKFGVNVNQIALASNRGRIDLARQEWQAVDELRRAFPRVEGYLRAVVNEQRRRGTRLFQKFIEAGRG